jgi:hypothetical protein
MLFQIVTIVIFLIGVSFLGLGIYLGFKRIKGEIGIPDKLNASLRIIIGLRADPFSLISIAFLLGAFLTLASTFMILDMLGYIKIE